MSENIAPSVYVVRAEYGLYADAFYRGGYVAIGWFPNIDMNDVVSHDREYLRGIYQQSEPDASTMHIAQNVGQIWRFLTELLLGTVVLTPTADPAKILAGRVIGNYYYEAAPQDECPYCHRIQVEWWSTPLLRSVFSVPLQNTLASSLTVFHVRQDDEVFEALNLSIPERERKAVVTVSEIYSQTIERILELQADEFEILVKELLAAMGFEAQRVGKVGDRGIDVEGVLNVHGLAEIDLRVQVKCYAQHSKIDHHAISKFRGDVPERSQAAFITTSDYTAKAREEAIREGYKRIGLINGRQLVEILTQYYDELESDDLKQQLRLQRALIPE